MISLITGVPGSGKTLFVFAELAKPEYQGRTVFFSGVEGLELREGWFVLEDGESWEVVPDGAVVVIDEVQRRFPLRKEGQPSKEVEALQTHRHRGVDLLLTSQSPMQVDVAVRRVVGRHVHLVRRFGTPVSTAFEWGECHPSADDPRERFSAEKSLFRFPRAHYGKYRSAVIHTHKVRIPAKAWAVLGVSALVLVGLYYGGSMLFGRGIGVVETSGGPGGAVAPSGSSSGGLGVGVPFGGSSSGGTGAPRQSWDERPTIPGKPWTAPIYAAVAKVETFPRIAGCMVGAGRACRCYSQQGTVIQVGPDECRLRVEQGVFDPFLTEASGASGRRPRGATRADAPSSGGGGVAPPGGVRSMLVGVPVL